MALSQKHGNTTKSQGFKNHLTHLDQIAIFWGVSSMLIGTYNPDIPSKHKNSRKTNRYGQHPAILSRKGSCHDWQKPEQQETGVTSAGSPASVAPFWIMVQTSSIKICSKLQVSVSSSPVPVKSRHVRFSTRDMDCLRLMTPLLV